MKKTSHRVSIGLPVYNGEDFVGEAIESLLAQTFKNFEIIISDNASTDTTDEICRMYAAKDSRIRYYRNTTNLGASANYTKTFELATGEYFKWAAHDDICRPEYLMKCVEALDKDPSSVLCHSMSVSIDATGTYIKDLHVKEGLDSPKPHERFRQALWLSGPEYVWSLMRTNSVKRTSLLGPYIGHDRPFLTGISLFGKFHLIPEVLFLAREHEKRSVNVYDWRRPREAIAWHDPSKAGMITFPTWRQLAEHIAGIHKAPLSWHDQLLCYGEMAKWIIDNKQGMFRDIAVATQQSSSLGLKLVRKLDRMAKDINTTIPETDTIILVDEEMIEDIEFFGKRKVLPFLEKDGMYWGQPPDDKTAIHELERLRQSGAHFIVFVKHTFWWLDYYVEFHQHLNDKFHRLLQNERFIIFDLRS